MRNGSHRFWPCIAAAVAVSVIAVPAASAGVVKYDTTLTITHELGTVGTDLSACDPKDSGKAGGRCVLWGGYVRSDRDRNPEYHPAKAVRECMDGRRVVLFRRRPGADRRLGTDRSEFGEYPAGSWGLNASKRGHVYAKVKRKVGDGYVCLADRSETISGPGFGT